MSNQPQPGGVRARGRFIALEGIDGAGTTTQLDRLAQHYGARLHATREPSTGPIGREIRRHLAGPVEGHALDPSALALLFAADRIDHLRREIEPALASGVHVVSDRYLLSSFAYQTLGARRADVADFNRLATAPDLTLYVDVSIDVAETRRARRGGTAEIFEQRALQVRVRDAYLSEVARLRSEAAPLIEIDGGQPVDAVFQAVLAAIETCIEAAARQSQ